MQLEFHRIAERYIKWNRSHRAWQRFARIAAVLVVFCTTYAMILPAITKEQNTFCGLEPHEHSETCYVQSGPLTELICSPGALGVHVHSDICRDASGNYMCGQADYIVHVHNSDCYDVAGGLVCSFPEAAQHVHTDNCYALAEAAADNHTHTDACYAADKDALICTSAEQEAHTHTDACRSAEPVLICQLPETEEHAHGDDCYEIAVVCGLIENEGHAHTDECYSWKEITICGLEEAPLPEPELICTIPVAQEHIHSDSCFAATEELPLTCTLAESETHAHNFLCYGIWELVCTTVVHEHETICFSDPLADVETEEVWKKSLPERTGNYVDDLLAIAKSQLHYTESEKNYTVLEDGETTKGYTRYGAWYGDPYGDWDEMFAAFCLYYAGADETAAMSGFPLESDSAQWVAKLQESELYLRAEDGLPSPGDLVFFNRNGDQNSIPDHVAIVMDIFVEDGATMLHVYEGDVRNQVQKNAYAADSPAILGYGLLSGVFDRAPEITEAVETTENVEATEVIEPIEVISNTFAYSDDAIYVEVTFPEASGISPDAVLTVTPIVSGNEIYDSYAAQAADAVDGTVANIALYDISFYTPDGTYIPVAGTAEITMGFVESPVDPEGTVQILHFAADEAMPQIICDVSIGEQEIELIPSNGLTAETNLFSAETAAQTDAADESVAEAVTETRTVVVFRTDGFSVFALVEVETGTYTANKLTVTDAMVNGTAFGDYATVTGLEGKQFVIVSASGTPAALTSVHIIHNDEAEGDTDKLKAAALVGSDDETVTVTANQNVLWNFIDSGTPGAYYIQSAADTTQYLNIYPSRTLTTSNTPQAISVAANKADENWQIVLGAAEGGEHLSLRRDGDGRFLSWGLRFEAENLITLAAYGSAQPSEEAGAVVTNLDGRTLMIVAVNQDNNDADRTHYTGTSYPALGAENGGISSPNVTVTVNNGSVASVNDNDVGNVLAWEFESSGITGSYYIKAVNTGTYLNITADGLTLSDIPMSIEVVEAVATGETVTENVVCLRAPDGDSYLHVNLFNNFEDSEFGAWRTNDLADAGNHFVLADLSENNGDAEAPDPDETGITDVTVSMNMANADTGAVFHFTAYVEYAPEIQFTWTAADGCSVSEVTQIENGDNLVEITFSLTNGGSVTFPIPKGSKLQVTENNTEGYLTSYSIDGGTPVNGITATVNDTGSTVNIVFANASGFNLPSTGRAGTNLYTMGGLLLIAAFALLLYYQTKRGKEEHASS